LPAMFQGIFGLVMSLPGWAVLAVVGILIGFVARVRE